MNSKQAKALPLHEFLGRLGYQSARTRGNDVWFTSPFRPDERTPSFKVDLSRNVWYDFGMGQGGTVIDLVQQLYRLPDVAGTLAAIEAASGGSLAAIARHNPGDVPAKREAPVIESVGTISDAELVAYLASRAIPPELARTYMQEIRYRVGGREYKALAFQNEAGGYEVRNAAFKGTVGKKDVTYLAAPNRDDAAVFEGGFDFLAALAHYGRERPESNVLVLNSISFVDRAAGLLAERGIGKLHTYLDHDKAGRDATERLHGAGEWLARDASGFYAGFKDVNDYLVRRGRGEGRDDSRDR